jgi:hypothetical protein
MHLLIKLHLITLLAALLLAQAGYSDTAEKLDVILGNNGSVVKGKIIERIEGKRITVLMQNGQKISIPFSKIAEITTSDADYEKRHTEILDSLKQHRPTELSVDGKFIHIQIAYKSGKNSTAVGLSGMLGILTNQSFTLGTGIGWDKHSDGSFLPIVSEIDYYIPVGKWMPYLQLHGGYSLGWLKGLRSADYGGFRWGTGVGLQKEVNEKVSLTAQVGYEHQSVGKITPYRPSRIEWLSASVGIKF